MVINSPTDASRVTVAGSATVVTPTDVLTEVVSLKYIVELSVIAPMFGLSIAPVTVRAPEVVVVDET